jgi:hypothetical protein
METDNSVISQWSELKSLVSALELDVVKNAKGVAAAGVRARKGLRELKQKAAELVKTTVELDKGKKVAKPVAA